MYKKRDARARMFLYLSKSIAFLPISFSCRRRRRNSPLMRSREHYSLLRGKVAKTKSLF